MAKTTEVTPGILEDRLRTRAQSKLKAELSAASSALRALALPFGDTGRGVRAALDRIESDLYQARVADAEKDEIEDFIRANDATRDLLRSSEPFKPAPKTARAS